VWARAGLVWAPPVRGGPQALTTRLDVWPAAVRGPRFTEGGTRRQAQAPVARPYPRGAPVHAHFA